MNSNLGRSIRLLVKSGAVKATSTVINSKPVRKVSTFMLTAWLKERAMLKGKRLSYIARVFAFMFDLALMPIEWGIIAPVRKMLEILSMKWAGTAPIKSISSK